MSDGQSGRASGTAQPLPTTLPAEEWQANWARTIPELADITRRLKHSVSTSADVSIMRSSQLDAARLDAELTSMLREQFLAAFALFRPAAVARLQPELTLLLDLLIFRFSVWEGQPLPGMALMNLRYRNEAAVQRQRRQALAAAEAATVGVAEGAAGRPLPTSSPQSSSSSSGGGSSSSQLHWLNTGSSSSSGTTQPQDLAGGHSGVEGQELSAAQRGLYCAGAVLLRYAWARLGHFAASQHWGDTSGGSGGAWRRRCWELMRRAESAYRLASLANFLAFLRTGRYRSLLERLLRARLVYRQPSAARAISFEYLNRQLVWSELSELLLFLLPLVNVKAIKHTLRSYLPRLPILSAAGGALGAAARGGGEGHDSTGRQAQQQPCPICSTSDILNPYAAEPCGHQFCYYCLRSHCLADEQYSCPLCLRRVEALQPCAERCGDGGDGGGSGG